jgi:hypothetical protein
MGNYEGFFCSDYLFFLAARRSLAYQVIYSMMLWYRFNVEIMCNTLVSILALFASLAVVKVHTPIPKYADTEPTATAKVYLKSRIANITQYKRNFGQQGKNRHCSQRHHADQHARISQLLEILLRLGLNGRR